MNNTEFCFVQDDSSHWYMIPVSLKGTFVRLVDSICNSPDYELSDSEQKEWFNNNFDNMMINDVSSYSFTNPTEIF